jgi:hypothetical protein
MVFVFVLFPSEKLMGEQVEGLVGMCLTGLRDSHPKVNVLM